MQPEFVFNDMFQGVTGRVGMVALIDTRNKSDYKEVKSLIRDHFGKPNRDFNDLDKQNILTLMSLTDPQYPSSFINLMYFEAEEENDVETLVCGIKLAGLKVYKVIRYSSFDQEFIEGRLPNPIQLDEFGNRISKITYDMNVYCNIAHDKINWQRFIDLLPDHAATSSAINREKSLHRELASRFMATIVKYPTTD